MKRNKKLFLIAALCFCFAAGTACVACGTSGKTTVGDSDGVQNGETSSVAESEAGGTASDSETSDDAGVSEPVSSEDGTDERENAYAVTFSCGEHVSCVVYATQADAENGENGLTSGEFYARDADSGAISVDGTGQINFLLIFDDGYSSDAIDVEGGYKNLKTPSDTGIDGVYRITKITSSLTVTVTAKETPREDENSSDGSSSASSDTSENEDAPTSFAFTCSAGTSVAVDWVSGTAGSCSVDGDTLYFLTVSADSVYAIAGEWTGNIVVDTGDGYAFELEMRGLTLISSSDSPLRILSGDEFTLTAKKGYDNSVSDLRDAIDETDDTQISAAVYAACDLNLGGKGSLTVYSENNNGIHTKDDLEVKNLTLSVTCSDNALKGNDGVTVESGALTLIATRGDGIKTSNSDVSSKGNQRGIVTVSGGTVTIYAACDGIDAAYDAVVNEATATTVLNIFTDKYSEYSEEVTFVSESSYYLRATTNQYAYSVRYSDGDAYQWANATYYTSAVSGRTTYYYYTVDKLSAYEKMQVYAYSSSQTQGQETSYYATSSSLSVNDSYDTLALTVRSGSLTVGWTNYTTAAPGGMGGMQEGNTDKGDYSTKGIKADNAVLISAGTIVVKAYDDAIHANSDVVLGDEDDTTDDYYGSGNITISGGTLTLYSNDDGIHADGALAISGGTVSVTNSYEGLEGTTVSLTGGAVSVISSDDGVNGTATSGQGIGIAGGTLYVYAGGDGLDSNSTSSYQGILISGGYSVVISTGSSDSSIDTENGYSYTGGYLLGVSSSGGMSSESTHCSNFSGIGKSVTLSLTAGQYLVATIDSQTVAAVKMPCSLNALAVYLGCNSVALSSKTTISAEANVNGVYWNAE